MYPHERSLVKKFAGKPFAIVGVNSDSDLKALQPVIAKNEITWRSFWNGEKGINGPISARWNVRSWPTIYIIDAEGRIRYKDVSGDALDKALEKLVAEAEGDTGGSKSPDEPDSDS